MAVYKNDRPEWLKQAIDSILNQTVKSDDIVIVRDGVVPRELEEVLEGYDKRHEEITIVRLEENVGAGQARNKGVGHAENELVAIMDADDISLPNRFELQLAKFNGNIELALVGGQLSEFEGDPSNITGYRKVPIDYEAIKKFARYRSPINHMTIMFDRKAFFNIGGYPNINRSEDYLMVSSMLAKGYMVRNLDSVLVNYRVGSGSMGRRKTWSGVKENIISRWRIYRLGVASLFNFFVSSFAQILLFIMPMDIVKLIISTFLRSKAS